MLHSAQERRQPKAPPPSSADHCQTSRLYSRCITHLFNGATWSHDRCVVAVSFRPCAVPVMTMRFRSRHRGLPALCTAGRSLLAAVLLTTGLTSCGGGDGGTAPAPQQPSAPRAASVVFLVAPASVNRGQSVQLTPTVRDAQGTTITRTVAWRSSDTTIATVSADGTVTGVRTGGPVNITATADGVSGSTPIRVIDGYAVQMTLTIGAPILDPGFGTEATVVVRDSSGTVLTGRPISFSISDSTVARITAAGAITARAAGQAVITATVDGATASAVLTVRGASVASVTVSIAPTTIALGQTASAQVTLRDSAGNTIAGRTVSWSSSNPSVAPVSPTGVITGLATGGPVTITAAIDGRSGSASVTVGAVPVASISVLPSALSLVQGTTGQLTATARDASGNVLTGRSVTWSSSSTTVAVVSAQGLVTALTVGSSTITASVDGVSATVNVSVTAAPVAAVIVTPATVTLTVGQTTTLSASPVDAGGVPLANRSVTWSSGNTGVATVDNTGRVTAVQAGTAVISATSEGRAGTAQVTVVAASIASITVSPTTLVIQAGEVATVRAVLRDGSGQIVTGRDIAWQTSDGTVVNGIDYDSVAVVVGLATGTATLTASIDGRSASTVVGVLAPPPTLCSAIAGAQVWSQDAVPVYLGRLTNRFDGESIFNTFGTYGSQFSALSINNQFGRYGSPFSSTSARNVYASNPPVLIKNGQPLAYFTVNSFQRPYVTPNFAATCTFP